MVGLLIWLIMSIIAHESRPDIVPREFVRTNSDPLEQHWFWIRIRTAMATVDTATDNFIQKTIRSCTSKSTVAHRLQTVVDNDLVLVLSEALNRKDCHLCHPSVGIFVCFRPCSSNDLLKYESGELITLIAAHTKLL